MPPYKNESEGRVAEITVDGRVIPVKGDREAIVFEIDMGFFKIVAIANIPGEDTDTAPVYIKIRRNDSVPANKTRRPQPRFRQDQVPQESRREVAAFRDGD